jgi:hypothetical protein
MVYQGTVQNGMVVFPVGIPLPDGTPVRVEAEGIKADKSDANPKEDIIFRMGEFAVETGIPDLAVNIDHYLYGHPKVTDEQP